MPILFAARAGNGARLCGNKRVMRTSILFFCASLIAATAADNQLAPEEKKAGWRLLFDGKTMHGWQDPAKKQQPGDAWVIQDGCLKTRLKPRIAEDLITEESFSDFELAFDWKVSPRGNTGVKYRIQGVVFVDETKLQKGPGGFEGLIGREMANPLSNRATMAPDARGFVYTIGYEMQLIDDERHPDAKKDPRHVTGALYSMIAPTTKAARPAGVWNSGRIVVQGNHFEHWINGVKVLEGRLDDEAALAGIRKRWEPAPQVLQMLTHPQPRGPICLQHHGDEVWFKNLKIRVR